MTKVIVGNLTESSYIIKRKATYIAIHRLTNQKPNQYYVYSFIMFYKPTTEIHILMRHPMSGNQIKKDLFLHS